jgi:hypothetical protein
MLLFRKKPLPPLKQAIALINEAVEIAYKHQRNKQYMPTKSDLELFKRIEQLLSSASNTAAYIDRCMQQRAAGEPEGSKKWHNDEVFDYHYPP